MREIEQVILNLSGYDNYSEVLIESAGTRIALSLYRAGDHCPCIVFIPGTMTHPLFYDDFLTFINLAKPFTILFAATFVVIASS